MHDTPHPSQSHRRSGHGPAQSPTDSARSLKLRLDWAFFAPNTACFGVTVTLGAAPGDVLAIRLFDTAVTLGLSLYLFQAVVLVATAHRFDRRCARLLDPLQNTLVMESVSTTSSGEFRGGR
ncbi:hypothetical protein OG226_41680 [Streptomyces sp. NBC_01261]|uniref:hypothetical protein n=1 Tax=unclassified Streptomyces TaxID=2593676 RepID=UPI002E326862|nr:hypothetical protein [Streptomyces sp. NBC_01261]